MDKQKPEGAPEAITKRWCKVEITLRTTNRAFTLPPLNVGDPVEVSCSLGGIKSVTAEEEDGLLVLKASGFTNNAVIEGEGWLFRLPDLEVEKQAAEEA